MERLLDVAGASLANAVERMKVRKKERKREREGERGRKEGSKVREKRERNENMEKREMRNAGKEAESGTETMGRGAFSPPFINRILSPTHIFSRPFPASVHYHAQTSCGRHRPHSGGGCQGAPRAT